MTDSKRPLWAPWRIDFIRDGDKDRCFLCGKKDDFESVDEELVIYRGENIFAILNRYPYNSGHLMLAPYEHVPDISKISPEARCEMMDLVVIARKCILDAVKPEGFNIGLNEGAAGGAGFKDHLHLHIVPRWAGDNNFMPVIGGARVVPEALVKTAKHLRKAWPEKE